MMVINKKFNSNKSLVILDISSSFYHGCCFYGFDFSGYNINSTRFYNCEFVNCSFNDAFIDRVIFSKCLISRCLLSSSMPEHIRLIDCIVSECDFADSVIVDMTVQRTIFYRSNFEYCSISDASFDAVDFLNGYFNKTIFCECSGHAFVSDHNISGANIVGNEFSLSTLDTTRKCA